MPRILIGASFLLITLSAVFGVLNNGKVKGLRTEVENATTARKIAEQARVLLQKQSTSENSRGMKPNPAFAVAEVRIAKVEDELMKSRGEKIALQTQLQEKEAEVAELKKQIAQVGSDSITAARPSTAELQAQLDETRKQLATAENEKAFFAGKAFTATEAPPPLEKRKQHMSPTQRPGLRGTILAVNQAYNFVVLNLGERQGVEANAEMLVVRRGTLIGKIRVSSVEPATAIGDIISSTLARGVQVQRGDNVIYAGTN